MMQRKGDKRHRVVALPVLISLLTATAAVAPQGPDDRRGEADIWAAAGDARAPANRAAVVDALRTLERERKAEAVDRARALGLPVWVERPDGSGARELMGWDFEHPLYYSTCNANAAISTGSNLIRVSPYVANGAGWTLGIWDGGAVRSTHREFGGRVTIMDGAALLDHATHVGGTLGATGVTASAIGMAQAARIDSYDWNSDASEMSSRGASYGGEEGCIYISNHSYASVSGWGRTYLSSPVYEWYGSGTTPSAYEDDFGKYNSYAQDTDARAYSLPYYLIFWAVGNDRGDNPSTGADVALSPGGTVVDYDPALHPPGDGVYRGGYDTIGFNALSKNVMTVGAVNDAVRPSRRSHVSTAERHAARAARSSVNPVSARASDAMALSSSNTSLLCLRS